MGIEEWRDIKGYEGAYEVSSKGRVKSLYRLVCCRGGKKKSVPERVLKPSTVVYKMVQLNKLGKYKYRTVHSLVAEAFLNHSSNGLKIVIDHIDMDKMNNNVSNLRIVTSRENSNNSDISRGKLGDGKKSSRFTGVAWSKSRSKWITAISINNKSLNLGGFDDECEARDTYLKAVKYEYLYKGHVKTFRNVLNNIESA